MVNGDAKHQVRCMCIISKREVSASMRGMWRAKDASNSNKAVVNQAFRHASGERSGRGLRGGTFTGLRLPFALAAPPICAASEQRLRGVHRTESRTRPRNLPSTTK
eukprot:3109351-Pleurochrysis_carterae.AAC.1